MRSSAHITVMQCDGPDDCRRCLTLVGWWWRVQARCAGWFVDGEWCYCKRHSKHGVINYDQQV